MIPIKQSTFYQEEPRTYGDCMRAAIASVLELSIDEVPHFLEIAKGDAYEFYDGIEQFLTLKGYAVIWKHDLHFHWTEGGLDVYHLMSGPSPRHEGVYHCVVGRNGVPYFDPHPDNQMLAGDKKSWAASFLIKV